MSGGNNQIMSNFKNKERVSMNVNREVGEFRGMANNKVKSLNNRLELSRIVGANWGKG